MDRYISLRPLHQIEQSEICAMLFHFFSPFKNEERRKELGLEISKAETKPLSLNQFLQWTKKQGKDLSRMRQQVAELVLKLEAKGILIHAGTKNEGLPPYSNCYYLIYVLSNRQKLGYLWLGAVLGAEYIGFFIKPALVLITGKTEKNDVSLGTGTLVLPGIVLTCAHVLSDMKVDEYVEINGSKHKIKKYASHPRIDVGVIYLEEEILPPMKDVAFRSARQLEEVIIGGYPTVPRGITPVITLNRGEITGHVETKEFPLTLFSAIARPGNSGGPVFSLDGQIVGIVTCSLERLREDADKMEPMPFFAAVPSDIIRDSFKELTYGRELPWEDYQ